MFSLKNSKARVASAGCLVLVGLSASFSSAKAATAAEEGLTASTTLAQESVGPATDYSASTPPPAAATAGAWKHSANGFFNLSQTYFDNWVKGGTNAMTWELRLEGSSTYEDSKLLWENKGKALYGRTEVADLNSRKSSDLLDLQSMLTYKLGTWVNPFAATQLMTQFDAGYNYEGTPRVRVSGPFDPTYLTQTLGVGYTTVPDLNVRIGGTLKETFSATRYGYADDTETEGEIETFKFEPGLSFTSTYKFSLMENILFSTLLDVFVNFEGTKEIDGRWENQITAKVNKYVSTNFGLDMLYDYDLSESYQLKQSLSIGISFLSL
jgi:Protein of unknown function (DUF3078)